MRFFKNSEGFSLIELLVVIAIIGILTAIVLVSIRGVEKKAKIARTLEWSHSIYHLLGVNAIGVWSFNEETGNIVNDISGNENHGILKPSCPDCPKRVKGVSGKALQFDGDNDYVDCGNDPSLNPLNELTIEFWVYREGEGTGRQGLVQKGENNYMVAYDADNKKIEFTLACTKIYSDSDLPLKTWTHITAVTVRGATRGMKLYINGNKQSADGTCGATLSSSNHLEIGRWGSNYFKGIIDEVRIYNEGFTPEMVKEHYEKQLALYKIRKSR